MSNLASGKYGEGLACKFLEQKGYRIIERNFRIRGGEIDIIAKDGQTLVYIEVKTRSQKTFGYPEDAINYFKIRFLERTAKFYRAARKNLPELERIDVVSVDLTTKVPTLKLTRNITL